jgi:hypothetical protein
VTSFIIQLNLALGSRYLIQNTSSCTKAKVTAGHVSCSSEP